jgi:hypothetical protein
MSIPDYWDANIRVLREMYPGLAEQLKEKGPGGDIQVETAASGRKEPKNPLARGSLRGSSPSGRRVLE